MPRFIVILFACFTMLGSSAMAKTPDSPTKTTQQRTWTKAERKAFYNNLITMRLLGAAMASVHASKSNVVSVDANGRELSIKERQRAEIHDCVKDVVAIQKMRDRK